jgi:hypothetical protein
MTTVKAAKAKARRLQDFTRDTLLKEYPDLVEGTDVRSAIMGETGVDIKLSPKALSYFPYSVECKAYKRPQAQDWYEQAKANFLKGSKPIVVFRGDRCEALVVLSMEDFMNLHRSSKC